MTQTNKRFYAIDILKIFAIFGVLVLHINGIGGILENADISSLQYFNAQFLQILFLGSVDIFAMITGFLNYKKERLNSYRIFEIALTTILYTIFFNIIMYAFFGDEFDFIAILKNTYRLPTRTYWYITCYIGVMILSPFINKMINTITAKQHFLLCKIIFVLFSIIPSLLKLDIFNLKKGYSLIWILFCYIIGAYVKRCDIKIKKSNCVLIYNIILIFLIVMNTIMTYILGETSFYLIAYNSPLIMGMSICLVLLAKETNLQNIKQPIKKIIILLSSCTLDVYIAHAHNLFYNKILKDNFIWILDQNKFLTPLLIIGCALILYIFFTVIGIIRIKIFEKSNLKDKFTKITKDKFSYTINS